MRKQRHAVDDARAYPVEVALDMMGGKWKAVILWRIAGGTHRFGALRGWSEAHIYDAEPAV